MNYLIIGNGVAGTEAALTLKKMSSDNKVTIITDSPHRFYFRPRLIECLGGDVDYDRIYVHPQEYFEQKGIDIIYEKKIASIDRTDKCVVTVDGISIAYDALLIASGATPFIPPIKNSTIEGFFALRTIDDAKKITAYAKDREHVVIAGGGLLGLECAHSLLKLVKKVTVVENEPFLLPRQLDKEGGDFLTKKLKRTGMDFVFSDRVDSLEGEHTLSALVLASGNKLSTNALVVSTGIRSETQLASGCGLAVNRGVVVDAYMRTSDESIFAAGDCAECAGRVYGLWMASKEQGAVAATNMSGGSTGFTDLPQPVVLKIPGADLFCAGDLHSSSTAMLRAANDDRFVQLSLDGTQVRGIAVIGDKNLATQARSLLQGRVSVDEFKASAAF